MRIKPFSLLALASQTVHGYLDTSPFFMFSTNELLIPTHQIHSGDKLTTELVSALSGCPSDTYLLVDQPGVRVSDFSSSTSAPTLAKFLNHVTPATLRSSTIIPEVAGEVDVVAVASALRDKCGAWSTHLEPSAQALMSVFPLDPARQTYIIEYPLPSKSQPERAADLLRNDRGLSSILEMWKNRNYTVIYITTPPPSSDHLPSHEQEYEMNNMDNQPLRTDLKRDLAHAALESSSPSSSSNYTLVDGPLFERYQFFTPGLFMGLLISLMLLSILYVAISGLASLQVSYAAFDKENGPAAQQRKAQ